MVRGCNSHYGNWHYKESRMGGHLGGDTLIFNYNYGVQNFGGYCSGKNTGFWGGLGLGLGASLGNWLMGGMQQFGGYMGNMMNCWTPSFSNFSNIFQPLNFSSLWDGFTFTMPDPHAKLENKTKTETETETETPVSNNTDSATPDNPTILEDKTIENKDNPADAVSVASVAGSIGGGLTISIPANGNRRILSQDELDEILNNKTQEYMEKYKEKQAVTIELFVDCYGDVKVKVRDYGPSCTQEVLSAKADELQNENMSNYNKAISIATNDENQLKRLSHSYGVVQIYNNPKD